MRSVIIFKAHPADALGIAEHLYDLGFDYERLDAVGSKFSFTLTGDPNTYAVKVISSGDTVTVTISDRWSGRIIFEFDATYIIFGPE